MNNTVSNNRRTLRHFIEMISLAITFLIFSIILLSVISTKDIISFSGIVYVGLAGFSFFMFTFFSIGLLWNRISNIYENMFDYSQTSRVSRWGFPIIFVILWAALIIGFLVGILQYPIQIPEPFRSGSVWLALIWPIYVVSVMGITFRKVNWSKIALRILNDEKSRLMRRSGFIGRVEDRCKKVWKKYYKRFTFGVALTTLVVVIWGIFGLAQDRRPYSWYIPIDSPDRILIFNSSSQLIFDHTIDGKFSQAKRIVSNRHWKLIVSTDFTQSGGGKDAGMLFAYRQRGVPNLFTRVGWQPIYGPLTHEEKELGVMDFTVADFDGDDLSEIVLVGAPKLGGLLPSLLVIIDETGKELVRCSELARFEDVEVLRLRVGYGSETLIAVSGWQKASVVRQCAVQNPSIYGEGWPSGDIDKYGVLYVFTVDADRENPTITKQWFIKAEPLGYGIFAVEAYDQEKDGVNESLTFWHGSGPKYCISPRIGLDLLDIRYIEGDVFDPAFVRRDEVCLELFKANLLTGDTRWCDESEAQ